MALNARILLLLNFVAEIKSSAIQLVFGVQGLLPIVLNGPMMLV